MRIKKLEIAGFKSFADKARLIFGEGITGVVGPNGCGKSNVVDAIRWCMGEMSAKHLRGKAMQDVIFAGSENRSALGMAEVTLTFHNDGNVPPAYLNYTELAVSRRLYRDGTSEYLINKVTVRLKDVVDLFLGTGVGTRAYSIIEQGRIGFVVNSRPEERRTLIEEVAGITKFKARKKAAERRMEATEQNLLRVNDIVTELERQLQTLRRQAKKAERYRSLRGELRQLEVHQSVLTYLRLLGEERVVGLQLQADEQQMADTQRDVVADESALEAARLQLLAQEQGLQGAQAQSAEMDAALATLERDIAHWREQQRLQAGQLQQAAYELQETEARLQQAEAERADAAATNVSMDTDAASAAAGLDAEADALAAQQDSLAEVDEALEAARQDALEQVQGATRLRSRVAEVDRRQLELGERLETAEAEQASLAPQAASLAERQASLDGRESALAQELDAWRAQRRDWREALPALRQQVKAATQAVRGQKDTLSGRRSRLASLQEVSRRLEGCSDGVRTLMGPADARPVAGLRGLVAEALQVPSDCEAAIEAALGQALQYILVDDAATAATAIAHLKAEDGGRSGFVPPALQPRPAPGPVPSGDGILGPALDQVQAADAPVVLALLADVLLVQDLAAAQALVAPGWRLVTLAGEVVEASGAVVGGSADGAGLLASRREIRELEALVQVLEASLATAEAQQRELEAAALQREVDLQQLEKDLHAAELEAMAVAKDRQATAQQKTQLGARQAALADQILASHETQAALEADASSALQAALAAEADQEAVESEMAELQERRLVEAGRLRQRSEALTAVKVRLAQQQEKAAAAAAAAASLSRSIDDLRARAGRCSATIASVETAQQTLHAQLAEGESTVVARAEAAQAARDGLTQARAAHLAEVERLQERELALKTQRRGGEGLLAAIGAGRLSLQKLALAREQLTAQVLERHDLPIAHAVSEFHLLPPPDAAAASRRQELERALKAMGAINLTAIDECAEVEARYAFLHGQQADLTEALEALRRAIARINRASRERFKEAFEAVNDMFQKVYPRLFRGGVARLELTSSDDLLEAGVDIVAMPPGKKLQNVGLLSGGEKALTATALVFSIFLIKPSPFCILDEVDAPLDEANVGRFNEMLREIAKVSQFIVITHNKQTMLQADRLYGITMEEPGMSKVVAVDLESSKAEVAA